MYEHKREKTTAALILAAGRSSRMQQGQENYHKLLLPLGQGTVMSQVLAATLASQAGPIILILGHQSAQIRASLIPHLGLDVVNLSDIFPQQDRRKARSLQDLSPLQDPAFKFTIAENPAYAQGMSTSLHKGIEILMNQDKHLQRATTQCDGVLVLLGDQPLITSDLLNQLIEMRYATGKRIIAPFYNGKRGNPVLFAADLFPELLTITGDEGARSVIEKHRTEVGMLDIDDAQLWYDVDTWEGYQQVLRIWQEKQG